VLRPDLLDLAGPRYCFHQINQYLTAQNKHHKQDSAHFCQEMHASRNQSVFAPRQNANGEGFRWKHDETFIGKLSSGRRFSLSLIPPAFDGRGQKESRSDAWRFHQVISQQGQHD
jgi:hypothetical protein